LKEGAPGIETRFVIGLFLLKHNFWLSGDGVCDRRVCDLFQRGFPHEYWRKRPGSKVSLHLAGSLRVAHEVGQVSVDTTVQSKNVTFPTDANPRCRPRGALAPNPASHSKLRRHDAIAIDRSRR
jgi:hypothetical protein